MMDLVSMWPLLAGGLGSAGLAGWWLYGRKRGSSSSRGRSAVPERGPLGRSASKSGPAKGRGGANANDNLDTLVDWEPVATRVLTQPEREAYAILRKALPDHMILAQVPLARFIKVPTRNSYSEWLRRVGSLCADLVVCDLASQVVAVVEVRQHVSREKERTQRRHARMDRVLTAAHIPVHVWLEGALPGAVVAREAILGAALASSGRSGSDVPDLVRRDAEAAAVVAAIQMGGAMEGMSVREHGARASRLTSSVDFNLDDLRAAVIEPDEDDPRRQDPPPSTWFDDLDDTSPTPLDETPANRPS